ncbi:MAG: inverse autotransporter beta domain-containing protein [Candidatus Omnitrophica bacterium]|nr:inverse autotransporter beta domain-containing protein [Candidatus Omnitrophota bacterium]
MGFVILCVARYAPRLLPNVVRAGRLIVTGTFVLCGLSQGYTADEYVSSLNASNQERYYPSKIRFAGQVSTEHRGSFYVDYLFPIWYAQDENSLIFFNPKQTIHTNSSDELNLGVGYRKIFWDKFIAGLHFFYDRKNSPADVTHEQVGWGLELLSEPIDFRFNYYDPTSGVKVVDENYSFGSTRLLVSHSYEEPLKGFDFEVGVPIEVINTRAYAGGFFYDSKIANDVEGYRIRTETDINNWLSLDLEMNSKNKQETEFVGGLRVTVPLEFGKLLDRKESINKLLDMFQVTQRSKLKERLLERVVRDIDIKTTAQTTAPVASTNTDVQEIVYVDNSNVGAEDGTRDNPWDTLAEALIDGRLASGVTIYVAKGDGTATGYTGNFVLSDGILLWGSGYNGGYNGIAVSGYPVIDGGGAGTIIRLGNNNTVMGLRIQNTGNAPGILGHNTTGADIHHNYLTQITGPGGGQPITLRQFLAGTYFNRVWDNILANCPEDDNGLIFFMTPVANVTSSGVISGNIISGTNTSGGIMLWNSDASGTSVTNVTITGNTISGLGSGITITSSGGMINTTVSGNTIRSTGGNGIYCDAVVSNSNPVVNVTLDNNTLSGNSFNGIYLYSQTFFGVGQGTVNANIYGNTVTDSSLDGVRIERTDSNIVTADFGGGSLGSAGNNSIYNNGAFDVNNTTAFNVIAENNWWGTDSPIAGQFNGLVDYTPWLMSTPN